MRSLKRNKKDVAPRTRRHVRAVRHGFGFHSRDVREKTRKFGRWVASPATATTDFLAPDILNKCGQGHRRGISAQSPDMGRSYVISDDGVGKIEVHGAQSGDLFPTRKLPPMKETE